MDYENIMNDMAVQMAASRLTRYPRYSFGSTPKRWSGRIEKSRSTHTSPAIHERRRAHSTTRPLPLPMYQFTSYDAYPMQQHQRPMRVARPFSWHPTSQTLPFYTVSQMTSPDTPHQIPTPPFSCHTSPPLLPPAQYPLVQTMFPEFTTLPKPSAPTPMLAASPVYSMDPYTPNSPDWEYFYDGQTPVIANNMAPNSPPTYPGSWYDTSCAEVSRVVTQPMMHLPQIPPMMPQESFSSMIMQQNQETIPTLPPIPLHETTPAEEPVEEPQMEAQEEEGEVLVALGLYDLPDETAPIATGVAQLKLTETWQPPPEDDDSSQEEDDDDEEDVKTPGAGTSWFH